jgi:cold shock CspA family protein
MEFGRIKIFLADKGFGFIEITGNSIHFRKKDVKYEGIRPDDPVKFSMRFDSRNRPFAINVERVENKREFTNWYEVETIRKTPSQLLLKSAEEALTQANYGKARVKFQQCIAQSEWQGQRLDESLFLSYGEMEYRLGRHKEAKDVYALGQTYCPSSSRIVSKLAKTLIDDQAFKEAEKLLTRFGRLHSPDENTQLQLVRVLLRLSEQDPRFISRIEDEYKVLRDGRDKDEIHAQLHFLRDAASRMLWLLLRTVQLTPATCAVEFYDEVPHFGYVLVKPGQQIREKYGFNKQLFVYYCFEPCSQIEAITRGVNFFNDYRSGREEEIHQRELLVVLTGAVDEIRGYLKKLREDPQTNPTIIPVLLEDAEKALNDNNATEYIEQLFDEWLSQIDRYRENYPVHGRDFFGRERDLAVLNKNIELGKPTGIFGLRKVGKTSILYQLAYIRTKDLVAYVDAQAATIYDCKFILWEALNKWLDMEASHDRHNGRPKSSKLKLSRENYATVDELPDFDEVLRLFDEDVRVLLAANLTTVKLVLLIDEIELITPSRDNRAEWIGALQMIRYLRGSAQNTSKRFIPIIAGANPKICEDPHWGAEDNPVFQFFDENFIPLLPETDCKELIVKIGELMNVSYEKPALDSIFKAVGGHPYFTRRLCSHIVSIFVERPLLVTMEMVEIAQEEFLIKEEALFKDIVFRLTRDFPDELEILKWVARGGEIGELKLLISTWNTSIKHLEGYQLIERDRDSAAIRIKIQLFEEWLKREG